MSEDQHQALATEDDQTAWAAVQEKYRHVPGEDGVRLRREHYRPFFQRLGVGVRILEGCYFSAPWRIVIDDNAGINRDAILEGSSAIRIGRNVRIGHRCFIHSANHDLNPDDPRAYFERGYEYAPVVIGDNALISANVSIMPGARIGAGAFIAAGAVVTAGAHADGERFVGAPARPQQTTSNAPAIHAIQRHAPVVFLTPHGDRRAFEGASLLAVVLACPQIIVQTEREEPPATTRVALWFGDPENPPGFDGIKIWTLAANRAVDAENASAASPPQGQPSEIRTRIAYNGFGQPFSLPHTMKSQFFLAVNRALKGSPSFRDENRLGWTLVLLMALEAGDPDDGRWDRVVERIGRPLIDDSLREDWRDRGGGLIDDILDAALARHAAENEFLAQFFDAPAVTLFAKVRAAFHGAPELLVFFVRQWRRSHPDVVAAFLEFMAPHMKTSVRLASLGCAAALLGDEDGAQATQKALFRSDRQAADANLILISPPAKAIDYSPQLAAFLIWRALSQDRTVEPIDDDRVVTLDWRATRAKKGSDATGEASAFTDPNARCIARGLFENWLATQEIPELPDGACIYLDGGAYDAAARELEDLWRAALAAMFQDADAPMLRIRPWPAGARACLALRYDVDRPTTAAQIDAIMRIQRRRLGAAGASWYFIDGAAHNEAIRSILKGWNQEDAAHLRQIGDAVSGRGVTAHSAANSEYWRGAAQLRALAADGAAYAEAMRSFQTPRPAWIESAQSPLWVTPLHFPLEGSVNETSTSYFEALRSEFDAVLATGGLAIINTHPDCDQTVLERVLDATLLDDVWVASVNDAVDRTRRLTEPGAILVALDDDEEASPTLTLHARFVTADVAIEITEPGGRVTDHVIQLAPGPGRSIRAT